VAKTDSKPVEKGEYESVVDREVGLLAAWYHADGKGKDAAAHADKLREAIKNHPDPDSFTVLASLVQGVLIDACISGQGSQVVLENELAVLRRQFDYENASGMERALIDRIVHCWLRLQICERRRAYYDQPGSYILVHIEQAEKNLHRAHNRYMQSIEELAKVRFLMSRTNPVRLQAVRETMKKEPQQEPGKLLELKAG
jgi:hypothetical protein